MKKSILAAAAVVALGVAVNAQDLQKCTKELGFGFEFISADDLKSTNLNIDYGYHFTAEHQGSALLEYSKLEINDSDSTGGFLGMVYDYNFVDFKDGVVPYLGGGLKIPLSDYKDIYDNVLFAHGGFKFFITKRTAIRLSLDIERYAGADDVDDSTALSLRAGYIVTFGPKMGSAKSTTKTAPAKSKKK